MQLVTALVGVVLLVAACEGESSQAEDTSRKSEVESQPGVAEGLTAEVVACGMEDGVQVVRVAVANESGAAGTYDIGVRVLGEGRTLDTPSVRSPDLRQGERKIVHFSMNVDAASITGCEIESVTPSSEG